MNFLTGILVVLAIIFFGAYGGTLNKNGGLLKIEPLIQPTSNNNTSNPEVIEITPPDYLTTPSPTPSDSATPTQNPNQPTSSPTPTPDPTRSKYKDLVYISGINRSNDINYENVQLRSNGNASTSISITGWTLKSESTGQSVSIPKSSKLFFSGSTNSEENLVLSQNETVFLITGYSPNGVSFKLNKCTGYLSQFQNWYPGLPYSCPAPRNEDLSSIPKTVNNDACLDYIDNMSSCRIQTETLPQNWSYECTNFIYNKINYPTCINTHKNDKDFWIGEWRVYLKRGEKLWKDRRESVVLIDEEGKIVSRYTY